MLRFYFDFYRSVPKFIITAIFSAALISLIVSPIGFFHYIRISFENLNKYFQNDFAKLVLLLAIATILSSFGNLMLSSVTKLIRHLLFYFVGDRVERGKKIGLIDILVLSSDQLINKFFVVYRDIFTAYFFTYYKAQLYLEKERSAYDFTRTIDSMLSYDNVSFNVFKEISISLITPS